MTESAAAHEAFFDALLEDDPVRLYEQAPCGFLSTTPDGVIVKINATLCSWLGLAREELVGRRSFVDLLPPGGRIYHETHYAPMLRMQDNVRELALELLREDGRRIPVLVNAMLDRDGAGEPRAVRIAVFDATERRRYEQELLAAKDLAEASEEHARTLARTLQQTLIPPTQPEVPGLEVAAAYLPAGDGLLVGGDFYDLFPVGHDVWGAMLGDVCGKGPEAAVVTALARWTVRAATVAFPEPSQALANLNDVLRSHDTDRFCTAVVLRLRREGPRWHAVLSLGGHPPPVLLRTDDESTPLDIQGPLLGVLEKASYTDLEVVLAPGEGLLLYTDGITEARRGNDFFDLEGLLSSIRAHGTEPPMLVNGLLDDVRHFQEGDLLDDVAVVALRVPAGDH